MENLIDLFVQFKLAVAASVLMGCVFPLLGVFFIMRRMALLGIALPQVASAGIAFIILIAQTVKIRFLAAGESPFLSEQTTMILAPFGSFAAILIVLFLINWLEGRGMFVEARLGTAYITSAAMLIIFLVINPYAEAQIATMLEGNVITVTPGQLWSLSMVSAGIIAAFLLFWKELLLVSFDPEVSLSMGVKNSRWNALLYLMFGASISVGVMILGPLFVFGYLLLPAFAARIWVSGIREFCILSVILGVISALAGSIASFSFNWPLGPTDVLSAGLVLLGSRIVYFVHKKINRKIP